MASTRPFNSLTAFFICAGITVAIVGVLLLSRVSPAQQVKKAPIVQSDPSSGKQMYVDYCAACHGKDGQGNGPAAAALKVPLTNLASLAKNNGGKYPEAHVAAVLSFGVQNTAHGSKNMPVWGQLFQSLESSSSAKALEAKQRINRLNTYVEWLQIK